MNFREKLGVYYDNFKRFGLFQIYYIFLNRIIKSNIPLVVKNYKGPLIYYRDAKLRTDLFLGFVKKWKIWEKSLINEDEYYCGVKKNILSGKTFFKLRLRDFKSTDPEISNNLYRFHLMAEITEELGIKSEDKVTLIVDWIDHVSPDRNLCWSGFNTSIRLINWIKIISSFEEEFQPNNKDWEKIVNSIITQAKIIKSNIEHQVPGNHVLIQYFTLWIICNIFFEWPKSGLLIEWSEKMLYEEINKEFQDDGLHIEFSFHYQIQVTLFCLIWFYSMSVINREIDPVIKDKVKNAFELITNFLFPDETIPMLGDNCYTFLNSSLNEDIRMCGLLYETLFTRNVPNNNANNLFIDTGAYKIYRKRDTQIIFDTGNIGYKYSPGHGHSDLLNVLFYDMEPVFIDPGTRTYENEEKSLLQKKTISHNTLSIDSDDQALMWGFFRWAYLPDKLKHDSCSFVDGVKLTGEYSGFKKLGKFRHRREVIFKGPDLILKDSIEGRGTHDIFAVFILAPNIISVEGSEVILINGKKNSWYLQTNSQNKYEILISPVNIFPAYGISRSSKKITIKFKSVILPFYSEIKISRVFREEFI